MADIFSRADGIIQAEPRIEPLTVVVLTDGEPPHNFRIVYRRGGAPSLCQSITCTLDADGQNVAVAEMIEIPGSLSGDALQRLVAGPVRFEAMSSEEFERRHGCRSTPS